MKNLLIILLGIIIVVFLYKAVTFYFNKLVKMKVKNSQDLYESQASKGLINKEYYDTLKKENIVITTADNLKLYGIYIKGDEKYNRTIIIVHGITASHSVSIKYAEMFIKKGWNVLIYDHRRHGDSEGDYTSYGYYEKFDLDLWVNWVKEREPEAKLIGLHGESMGAATVLQYASINKYVDFIIADCGYSDLYKLLKIRMREDYHFLLTPLIQLTSLRVLRKAKFKIKKVKPIEDIKYSDIPTLFIHGTEDKYVPTFMGEAMYRAKKNNKKLYLAEKAAHACSIDVDKVRYEKEVFDFIEEYFD
jgi:fermentation-respiration switch protein FrsA (DUF1100 family)